MLRHAIILSALATFAVTALYLVLVPVFHFNRDELKAAILITVAIIAAIEPWLRYRIYRKDNL